MWMAVSHGRSQNTNPLCARSNSRRTERRCSLWQPFRSPRINDGSLQTAWVLDVANAKQRKVSDTTDFTHTARWSPDGKWIAYLVSRAAPFNQTNLFVASADGGKAKKLTEAFELNAGEPV